MTAKHSLRRFIILTLSLSIIPACSAKSYQGKINDAEVHLVDYFQHSAGTQALIANMDKLNIDHSIVMGLPVIKKWSNSEPNAPRFVYGDDTPVYYYSYTDELVARGIESLPLEQQERLHPFLSGFNATDLNAAQHIERELKYRPGFWQGIGEIITRHDLLTALTPGEKPKANHPALTKVYQLAAEYQLPVLLHTNITSQRENQPIYLTELEQVLRQHPNTHFIWAHAGTTDTLTKNLTMDFLYPTVSKLLAEYPNLSILASWSLADVIIPNGIVDKRWTTLVSQYPKRFMIGSDVVGSFGYQQTSLALWFPLLNRLTPETAHRIAYQNILDALPKNQSK